MDTHNHLQALPIPFHAPNISAQMGGSNNFIYPTLVWDDNTVILVDTGLPGQLSDIQKAMQLAGVPFERLQKVILTHHDLDHMGSLSAVLKALPGKIEVLSYADEKDFIEGKKVPLKLEQFESQLDALSDEQKKFYEQMKAGFHLNFSSVDRILSDGERLDWCGGIQVIATPGHTVGHICLYLPANRTLIAGDALRVAEDRLAQVPDSLHHDPEKYLLSLRKLMDYDINQVICYHGGICSDHVNEQIKELVNSPIHK